MSRWLALASALALAAVTAQAQAQPQTPSRQTILFVGNSYTFGPGSAAWKFRPQSVTDLNGQGTGGLPALFKAFTQKAGLNYDVSLETQGGIDLAWHLANKRAVIDKPWDAVVLQDFSTLSMTNPGDPATLLATAPQFASLFAARNPNVKVWLTSTWTRADLTYRTQSPWLGKPVRTMACELFGSMTRAAATHRSIAGVNPVGLAFNRAIATGVADGNPYDGIAFNQLGLWTYDFHHASTAGMYLNALVVYAKVTGQDPRKLGANEQAGIDLGLSGPQIEALEKVAAEVVADPRLGGC